MTLYTSYSTSDRVGVAPPDRVDASPVWPVGDTLPFMTDQGCVEALYLQAGTSGVMAGNLCVNTSGVASPVTAADPGKPLCVALAALPAGSYGWFAVTGTVPVLASATTAPGGRVFLAANGQTTSVTTAGKAILNAVFAEPLTITSGYKPALATLQHPTLEVA